MRLSMKLSCGLPSAFRLCYNIIMAIAQMFIWWYASGWRAFIARVRRWFSSIADFFSMDSLLRTLFKPFRQISAGSSGGSSLNAQFQMFIDRLISRLIGFTVRLMLLFVGVLAMLCGGIFSAVIIVLWPFIPLLPIAGIVLTVMGVSI